MLRTNYTVLPLLLTLLVGCTKDFETINTNPNAPVDVQPSLLLRKVIFDYGEQMAYEGFVAGNLLGQQFTAIDFNLFDRHALLQPQFGGNPWNIIYPNLRDNEILLAKSRTNSALAVYEGPALVLKAFMTATLTDLFGAVPYSQALDGKDGIVTPAYDRQQDIYLAPGGILDNLDEAIRALESYQGGPRLEGDILYGGNLALWVRMAHSLKLKYLMRISAVHDSRAELQRIYASGKYIRTAAEEATFDFTANQPNNFRLKTARVGDFNLYIMSETMQEVLDTLNDPRRAVWFRPTGNQPARYRGLRNGPDASQLSISVSDYSLSGTIFREKSENLDANFMTAFETSFLLAEAAARGLIAADARTLYEQGVQQAFEYWMTPLPESYLRTGRAAFAAAGTDPIAQIITQKWLANIGNGYEGWIEYRRTGFPRFKPVIASLNNGLIPVRFPYPATEEALNGNNYRQVTEAIGGNNVNARVWWDRE